MLEVVVSTTPQRKGQGLMKQRTATFITRTGVAVPAVAVVLTGAVQSGVDETKCLQATMEPCPATNLLGAEPDMPVENGAPVRVPVRDDYYNGTTVSTTHAPRLFVQW